MIPADQPRRLRHAIDILEERATDARDAWGDTPWEGGDKAGWIDPHGGTYTVHTGNDEATVAEALCEELAVYIATMDPGVGLALVDVLRLLGSAGLGDDRAAVTLVDKILGGAS